MKKRNPVLPAVLAIFSIASIGIIYAKSTEALSKNDTPVESAPMTAELKDVSKSELLAWMTKHNIQYLTEQSEEATNDPTKYSVYFDQASAQDIVVAISVALDTEWQKEGEIYVLIPRDEFEADNARPKRVPFPIKGVQMDRVSAATSFGGHFIATVTTSQFRDQMVEGSISTESLSDAQKQLIAKQTDDQNVNMVIASQGRIVHVTGGI